MEIDSARYRRNIALAIAALAVLLAWFASQPAALLVAVAAICICFGWRWGLAAVGVTAIFSYAIRYLGGGIDPDALVELAVIVVAALGLCSLAYVAGTSSVLDRAGDSAKRIIEAIPGLGWTADPRGRIRFFNPEGLTYIGWTAEEMEKALQKDMYAWRHVLHPDDVELSLARFRHSIATGEPLHDEARSRGNDGRYRWFRDTAVPARDDNGRITGWFCTTIDVDDQKRAEEALRQSERELRLLVDTVPTMIFLMTTEGLPYYFNKRFVDWAGVDPGDPTGQQRNLDAHVELIHPDDRADVAAAFMRSFATGEPMQYKGRLRRKDGEYRWLDSRVEPLRDETGDIIRWYGVNIDINDEVLAREALRLADERLARASRAASLSELSVSIAHELNSPLQAVVSNANAFQRWLNADPPNYPRASRTAERIIRDANAAAEVIARIRALFSQSEHDRDQVDLNAVIREVCDLSADKLLSSNVRLDLGLDPNLPRVTGDRVQLEQVVLNLVRNAVEAMLGVPAPLRSLRIISRHHEDDTVSVEIEDKGPGIRDPERIFEAFFTTKEDGMGMGLAICRSIIEAHRGRIGARSLNGRGSVVGFTLPLHVPAPADPVG